MLRENLFIFVSDLKIDWATKTHVLTSAPKFLCLVVHFGKKFWLWYETEILPKTSYSGIKAFLEIQTLNGTFLYIFSQPTRISTILDTIL